jgi:hypothetical protein
MITTIGGMVVVIFLVISMLLPVGLSKNNFKNTNISVIIKT